MAQADPTRDSQGPTTLVIFGASGDLARRKLVPALASLHSKGRLPTDLQILGVARSDMDDVGYLAAIEEFLGSDGMSRPTPSQWQELSSRIHYMHGDVTSQADLADVRERLAAIEGDNYRLPPPLLPVPGALPVRAGHQRAGRGRHGRRHPRLAAAGGGETLRHQPGFCPGAERHRPLRVPGRPGFPHRPLPGQGNRPEPAGLPVRQLHL